MTPDPTETEVPHQFRAEDDQFKIKETPEKIQIIYPNVVVYCLYHISAIYGLYLALGSASWYTLVFNYVLWLYSVLGITLGSHRLWTHRAYKAKLPLQIILMIAASVAAQMTITNWVKYHRIHHKYTDTNADPHNARRGFFFSHIGWLMCTKHSEVKRLGKTVYMDDIYNNPVLRFQKKHAILCLGLCCFVLPTLIPIYFWNETLNNAWHISALRFVVDINAAMMINSVAHKWGTRPYNKDILPVDNKILSFITLGEGFHNYHHSFPWDYRTGELGNNWLNPGTHILDMFAKIGWAYDLKTASPDLVEQRKLKAGDGSYHHGGGW